MPGRKKTGTARRRASDSVIVFVDEVEAVGTKSFLGRTGSRRLIPQALSLEKFHRELNQTVARLSSLFDADSKPAGSFQVQQITLNLGVAADGKVGLLGLASGSVSTSAGIQVTLSRASEE